MTATATLAGVENQLAVGKDAAAAASAGQDFHPLRFSASASASGELAFVGFGISSPERGYDDYRGDVKGRSFWPSITSRAKPIPTAHSTGSSRHRHPISSGKRLPRRRRAPRRFCSSAMCTIIPARPTSKPRHATPGRNARRGFSTTRSPRGPTAFGSRSPSKQRVAGSSPAGGIGRRPLPRRSVCHGACGPTSPE